MAAEPIDLSLWVTRLRDQLSTTQAKVVALSTSAGVIEKLATVTPAVYVLRQSGTARRDGEAAGSTIQFVDCFVEIAMVTRKFGDAAGGEAVDAIRALRIAVWGALIGWTPADAGLPVELDRYTDGDPQNAVLISVDRFATAFQIRT